MAQTNKHDAQYFIDIAWDALVAGNAADSLSALIKMAGRAENEYGYGPDSPFSSERLKVARFLLTYRYPELHQVSDEVKRIFALVATWKSFLSHFQIDYQTEKEAWDKAELIAPLLGIDYVLDEDLKAMHGAIWGGNGEAIGEYPRISYEKRTELSLQFSILQSKSLTARTAFCRATRFAKRSGLVEYQKIGPPDNLELEHGLNELAELGFIDLNPDLSMIQLEQLTSLLTLKDLRQLAVKHGIRPYGPKYRLAEEIIAQVDRIEVNNLLLPLKNKKYARLLLSDLPHIIQYTNESFDLGIYVKWIERVPCLNLPPPTRSEQPPPTPDKDLKPHFRFDDPLVYLKEEWSKTEVQLMRRIWDSNCDEIVRDLANKYAWDFMWYVTDAILAYLPTDRLVTVKQALEGEYKLTHVRGNALMYFGQARIAELEVKIREPRLLDCAACGKQLREWSIHPKLARRVGHKIHFCNDCYTKALFRSFRSDTTSMSKEEMLDQLAELAVAMESIPLAKFVEDPNLEMVSDEKQVAIVKALIALPLYREYVEAFGSWLKALISARILEDGKQISVFGTRCIARDGHECLSLSEKVIDDWLSERNIPHEKEPLYPYHDYLNPLEKKRADWQVGESLIEYAGLMDNPEYAARLGAKQELAIEFGLSLIIIEPEDILQLDKKLGHLSNLASYEV